MGNFFSKSKCGDKIIVLVGPTGCGKSQFIRCLVPEETKALVPVNGGLTHIPSPIQSFKPIKKGDGTDSIVLIDTPGYEETGPNSPENVLKQVVKWVNRNYPKAKVTGILCLHRITDNRLTKSNRPPTNLLSELCGKKVNAAKQVALVTTHWDKTKHEKGKETERQLQEGAWALLSTMGAKMDRFSNTEEDARGIIERLL